MPNISKSVADKKINKILKDIDNLDSRLVKNVIKDLNELKKDIQLSLTSAGEFETRNLTAILSQIDIATERFQAKLSGQTTATQNTAWQHGTNIVDIGLTSAGKGALLPLLTDTQLLAMQTGTMDLISDVTNVMKGKIRNEIRRATMGGQSVYKTMQGIDSILGTAKEKGITKKAEDIVRTEMSKVFNTASYLRTEQAVETGIKIIKWWLTAGDERVRDTHRQAGIDYSEDKAIPFEDDFIVGGSSLRYPGDPLGDAKEVINCRCIRMTIAEE